MSRNKAIYNEFSTKICVKCSNEFPATKDYFHKKIHGKYGLREICKQCIKKYDAKRYPIKKENQAAIRKIYLSRNAEKIRKRDHEYKLRNKEKIKLQKIEYYNKNKGSMLEAFKRWRSTEKGKKIISFYKKKDIRRYRYLKKILINDLTFKQWVECLNYFDSSCAYCGIKKDKLSIDHILPVTKLGGTTMKNIVPSCVQCNSSKNDNDFYGWYKNQSFYNEERNMKILNYMGD